MSTNRVFAGVCRRCARHGWLLSRLSAQLDALAADPARLWAALELCDRDLIAALVGDEAERARLLEAREGWPPTRACPQRGMGREIRASAICRHHCRYPERLRDDPLSPHVLTISDGSGDDAPNCLLKRKVVAIAGARAPSAYGLSVTRALATELVAAGITVAGSADGVGAAAREAAVVAGGRALYAAAASSRERIAVCAGPTGGNGRQWQVSEPVTPTASGRWGQVAAERTLALIADLVLVPQAHAEDRFDLACAEVARSRGVPVAVVPGPIDSPASRGSNLLLATGAHLVCDAREALDPLFGVGARVAHAGHLR